jgi:hypothetical protein
VAEFIQRLRFVPAARSADEALTILSEILTAVEDEFTDIPANPSNWKTDGRLYPPQEDSRRPTGNPLVARYRTRAHNVWIGANGSIEIGEVQGDVVLRKAGADGRYVWQI